MKKITLFVLALLMAALVAQSQEVVRGDWVACPNILKNAGVCVNGEAIMYIIAPVQHAVKARDAICWQGGYQATVDDENGNQVPNPESCKKFAVKSIYMLWREWHAQYTARASAEAAALAAYNAARQELGEVVPEDR